MAIAYLSLGSNINPQHHLGAAIAALRRHFDDVAVSPIYAGAAVGFDGPPFLNAAARVHTELRPEALNAWLHQLEDRHARDRSGPRFSSRTLDVDLLLYDDLITHGAGPLQLPRPELETRAFVLKPMLDLAPDLLHPSRQLSLRELYARLPDKTDLHAVDLATSARDP